MSRWVKYIDILRHQAGQARPWMGIHLIFSCRLLVIIPYKLHSNLPEFHDTVAGRRLWPCPLPWQAQLGLPGQARLDKVHSGQTHRWPHQVWVWVLLHLPISSCYSEELFSRNLENHRAWWKYLLRQTSHQVPRRQPIDQEHADAVNYWPSMVPANVLRTCIWIWPQTIVEKFCFFQQRQPMEKLCLWPSSRGLQ